ncbi:hypothetical protein HOC35_01205 [Candidatus Woesearchaeota archaeon]|jgi:hypothetical protein|nr:hypothetical protein [Candidatus Woesearchaeota archaeon]
MSVTIDILVVNKDYNRDIHRNALRIFQSAGFYEGCRFTFHDDSDLFVPSRCSIPEGAIIYTHAGFNNGLIGLRTAKTYADHSSEDHRQDLRFIIDIDYSLTSEEGFMKRCNDKELYTFLMSFNDNEFTPRNQISPRPSSTMPAILPETDRYGNNFVEYINELKQMRQTNESTNT